MSKPLNKKTLEEQTRLTFRNLPNHIKYYLRTGETVSQSLARSKKAMVLVGSKPVQRVLGQKATPVASRIMHEHNQAIQELKKDIKRFSKLSRVDGDPDGELQETIDELLSIIEYYEENPDEIISDEIIVDSASELTPEGIVTGVINIDMMIEKARQNAERY